MKLDNFFTFMYFHPIGRKKRNRKTEICEYSLYLTNQFLLWVFRSFPLYLALVSQVLSFLAFLLQLPGRHNYKVLIRKKLVVSNFKWHVCQVWWSIFDIWRFPMNFLSHLVKEGETHPRKEPENQRNIGVTCFWLNLCLYKVLTNTNTNDLSFLAYQHH